MEEIVTNEEEKVELAEEEEIKRFVELSWKILENKFVYYKRPDLPGVSDNMYDEMESEYRQLAEKLELEPTATNMVGFVASRPSCQLVIKKFDKQKLNDQDTEQDSE
jgi:NAD-dependent DNA ligase|tara:strand:- start:1947 stop:2267 length:321 start_codon:yes stop_codon:yes gene_type:complete